MSNRVTRSDKVPWSSAKEWVVWLILLIIATLFIHNGLRYYKKHR